MNRNANMLASVALAFILVSLICACSPRSKTESRANNKSSTSTTMSSQTISASEMQSRQETMLRAIKREAQWSKLTNLSAVLLRPGESELRLWADFVTSTRCFDLKDKNGKKRAVFISAEITHPPSRTGQAPRVLPVHTVLNAPQSGWLEFDRYLKEQGIEYPLRFSLDDKHSSDPDEGSIVIEMKSGANYSMVFFPLFTETADGKRALEVCRKIEQEFHIKLGCGTGS